MTYDDEYYELIDDYTRFDKRAVIGLLSIIICLVALIFPHYKYSVVNSYSNYEKIGTTTVITRSDITLWEQLAEYVPDGMDPRTFLLIVQRENKIKNISSYGVGWTIMVPKLEWSKSDRDGLYYKLLHTSLF